MAKFAPLVFAAVVSLCTSVLGALPSPNTLYYIRNVLTGFVFDVEFSSSSPGTPIIGQTVNSPETSNQKWYAQPIGSLGPGKYGFQCAFPTIVINSNSAPGSLLTAQRTGTVFTLIELGVDSGVFLITVLNTTVTSSTTPTQQLTVEPFDPANPLASQLWQFVPV